MAKCVYEVQGDFQHICDKIKKEIIEGSFSASLEDEEYLDVDGTKIGVIVFERYSYTGKNRLSLNVTIIEKNQHVKVIGMSSGGSQGMIFKINTFGEQAFLDKLSDIMENYKD